MTLFTGCGNITEVDEEGPTQTEMSDNTKIDQNSTCATSDSTAIDTLNTGEYTFTTDLGGIHSDW